VVIMTETAASMRTARLADLEFTVVDIETTGWAPDDAAITEIGAVRVRAGRAIAEYGSLVNPGTPVPPPIAELTGITDELVADAPAVGAVLSGLLAFAEGSVLAAHNAPFDLRFLTAACAAMGRDWPGFEVLDTVRLARHLMATPQEVPDRKLATLALFFGTPVRPSHRALDDARATAVILGELLDRLAAREGIMTLGQLDAWLDERDAELAAQEAELAAADRELAALAEAAARDKAAGRGSAAARDKAALEKAGGARWFAVRERAAAWLRAWPPRLRRALHRALTPRGRSG
jgi:DNA polymerase III epsilon subunit family exonuclease